MLIGGFEACTLIDYPGKISCIVYTIGCNYKCKFCYNVDIINPENFEKSGRNLISEKFVFDYIKRRSKMIDAVTITGGEPTIQPDLCEFCKKVKNLGKLVKLDTNGSNPNVLRELIDNKLVDYIAMDLKGPFSKYEQITGNNNILAVTESLNLLKNSDVQHEFRLTLFPELKKEDILEIISIVGNDTLYLQQFEPSNSYDLNARKLIPYDLKVIKEILDSIGNKENIKLRGFL